GENFGSTVDAAALKAAFTIDDSIWQKHDPNQYEALGEAMSAMFADIVRAKTGFPQDLFCGSGNSGWEDSDKPGKGDFTCTPVRVTVEKVERGNISADEGTAGVQAINQQRLENAIALYGDDAAFWLALQDTIAQCKAAGSTTCIFNIGGVSAPSLPLPTPTPSG
ncbi:hypothetical protein HY346_01470, partial [Candidatus Microgenomates bacterium]|nr:hypothetical protein [Candidatus Microgenomates bacterium]